MLKKEETREEIAARIAELQRQYDATPPSKDDSLSPPEFVACNQYEACYRDNPMEVIMNGVEAANTSITLFKKASIKELEGCLRFFEGETQSVKKQKLLMLLRRDPDMKTQDLKKLEQRLYFIKNWMTNHKIEVALEDVPLTLPIPMPEKDE